MKRTTSRQLKDQFNSLIFECAYPESLETINKAKEGLVTISESIHDKCNKDPEMDLFNGFWGSSIQYSYSFHALKWLVENFPDDVSLAWDEGSLGDEFDNIISIILTRFEVEGVNDTSLTTQEWFGNICPPKDQIKFLIEHILGQHFAIDVTDYLFEKMNIEIIWKINKKNYSLNFCRSLKKRTFIHKNGFLKKFDWKQELNKPIQKISHLAPAEAKKIIDICQFSILSRQREIDTLNYVNLKDVSIFTLPRGYDLVLFGMIPEKRRPLDSYIGFVLMKNSIPIGYGGGWILLHSCEIGLNIFENFRGAESSYQFIQILKVYSQYFNISQFKIDPYQIGHDNDEAIDSAAFWFYYKLGFRPWENDLKEFAKSEWEKLQTNKKHRTTKTVLRKLAQSHMNMKIDKDDEIEEVNLALLGQLTSKIINKKKGPDLEKKLGLLYKSTKRFLGIPSFEGWSNEEVNSFQEGAPFIDFLKPHHRWTTNEKKDLIRLIKLKAHPNERKYIIKSQKFEGLQNALHGMLDSY